MSTEVRSSHDPAEDDPVGHDVAATATAPATTRERRTGPSGSGGLSGGKQALLLVAFALLLAVGLKTYAVQAFSIPSDSMEPTLAVGDRVLVQKFSYRGRSPERGDVVVFEDPGGWLGPEETNRPGNPVSKALAAVGLVPQGGHLVKRVVAVEGDVVTCCDAQGRIAVNGQALDEDAYVPEEKGIQCRGPMTGDCSWKAGPVPEGKVFVMGDNRGHSEDSTAHLCLGDEGPTCEAEAYVDEELVVGKLWLRFLPFDRFGTPAGTSAFDGVPDPS